MVVTFHFGENKVCYLIIILEQFLVLKVHNYLYDICVFNRLMCIQSNCNVANNKLILIRIRILKKNTM